MSLITKIKELETVNTLSKHEQLVLGIIDAIDSGILSTGDQLPSINNMVNEVGFARKTIVKAYEELKERGLVESKKLKGYFIISQETKVTLRIALLLFSFQRFQEEFYNTFRKELGKKFQIDVFFHHNNKSIFETIMTNVMGKYGMYVVAPIPDKAVAPKLRLIEPKKLLIIDRYLSLGNEYSFISQEFEESTYLKLIELLPAIKRFKKFVLFYREDSDYPKGVLNAFKRFLGDYSINGKVKETYKSSSLKKGDLYFFISDTLLWDVVRDAHNYQYKIGKDIGLLSHNDHVIKELVFGGITTISTDFKAMAIRAAKHIKNQETTQLIMPSDLIRRNSL
ncbi:GntR family transcriptional regulator [Costertonia aggregata]|uniref:GntR family transcriptional regulator n=1 Tax=Costertonia aggregata TaxID=343403 RepID=A0A7H9ALX3_9FLAO|nr:GntR family transcriptional regulator [Costertonia aggregata]QLG44374.1 GntR family transcriptional regulator [Costertonia aggregata]